jgi:hypothetical protein
MALANTLTVSLEWLAGHWQTQKGSERPVSSASVYRRVAAKSPFTSVRGDLNGGWGEARKFDGTGH